VLLRLLAGDKDAGVRYGVAANVATPEATLIALFRDREFPVALSAFLNKSVSDSTVDGFCDSEKWAERYDWLGRRANLCFKGEQLRLGS